MRHLPVVTALVISGTLAAPAGLAEAASKVGKPTIERVTPMRVSVGKTLTIRGAGFAGSRARNTVMFSAGKRQAFAKPRRASRTKLVVRVPASVENLLAGAAGRKRPTRLRVRVITRRYGARSTFRLSPIVVSGGGTTCRGADGDGDLLDKGLEQRYALDPCKRDSDGDGLDDGWEYWSAKDLNAKAAPYPGKRPFPNPLDKRDANYDFDGDSLTAATEFRLWTAAGRTFEPQRGSNGLRDSVLGYSDGTQTSRPDQINSPPFANSSLSARYPARYEARADGVWSDDERDADNDGLSNYVEDTGPGKLSWWKRYFVAREPGVGDWPNPYYGNFDKRRPFADADAFVSDVDGDGLLDGEDDQDNDDVLNLDEMYDQLAPAANGKRKNAFNPCAPDESSRTCSLYQPL